MRGEGPTSAARLVIQATQAVLGVPVPPLQHSHLRHPDPVSNPLVGLPVRRGQHDPRPLRQTRTHAQRARDPRQFLPITITQNQCRSRMIRHAPSSQHPTVHELTTRSTSSPTQPLGDRRSAANPFVPRPRRVPRFSKASHRPPGGVSDWRWRPSQHRPATR